MQALLLEQQKDEAGIYCLPITLALVESANVCASPLSPAALWLGRDIWGTSLL